jgi:FAD/FMN-containing dehydrogenase
MTDLIGRTLRRLAEHVAGRLSVPSDAHYAAATALWAKPIGPMPRAVVHCRTPQDAQSAIRAARHCDLRVSVRGGGHDWAGRALCDGLAIDMSGMNAVVVAADGRSAWISGGARAADVLDTTDALGLAAVAGSCGAVGMAGLTLGGGYGPLIGRCGLALDNLLAAEVVLADGRLVTASPENETELFWALRGGGGNFGVVTAMRHRLHPVPSIRTGMLLFPFSEAKAVLERCSDITAAAPEELTVQLGLAVGIDRAPVVMIVPTWCGSPEQGEAQLAPFFKLGKLLAGTAEVMPYGHHLTIFDPYIINGQRVFMETCWLPTLDRGASDAIIAAMATAVSPGCAIFTHEFRGAAVRVPADATAFGLRRDHVLIEILAAFADRGDQEEEEQRHKQWADATRQAFGATALPGGYPNLLAGDDPARAAKSFGRNAQRLIAAKRNYDPENLFRSAISLPIGSDGGE